MVNVPVAIALAHAFLAQLRGDAEGTAAFASQAQARLGEGEWMLGSVAQMYLAVAAWLRGGLAEAERTFASILAESRAAGQGFVAVRVCEFLGEIQRAQGRLDTAAGTYRQALDMTARTGRPPLPAASIGYVGLAQVEYQRNELGSALQHLMGSIALCRQFAYTQPLATGLATLAWIRQAQGDPAGALEAIEQAERVAPAQDAGGLLNPVPAQRARLQLAQGDLAAATRWTDRRGLGAGDEPSYPQEQEYLVLARVLLAQHRPGPALGLLERLHAAALAQGRAGSVIEILALRALALAASGQEADAVDTLAQALTLACPQGNVRVFADEGGAMSTLLGRLVAAQRADQGAARAVPLGCLAQVLRAFGGEDDAADTGRAPAAAVPGLVDQLTARELEILVLLAAGTPNPRIAEELVVSLDTVKKHVSHVLAKLGATNRTEAVARARQLGLIP